ncbi:MAG: sodium:proton exchanger, partial [Bacteroidetes bacterium]|nr:sodium:proton exchanger [Bacteroidota bacterium]
MLVGIVSVIVLGIGAQWLAWRFRVPSILLLLIFGFVAGPVTGFLEPASLQGDWVFAFVSLSIGIILFEGGLNLRLGELREVGTAVRNLISVGVLVTWALAGLGAYYIVGLSLSISVLVGAILTVTGPTVVIPLLRHVRPSGRVGTIAKWEGITIDPVGAILSVLVLEAILLINGAQAESFLDAAMHAVQGLFSVFFISVGVSITGAAVLILLLHRRLVPDYLQSSVALMVVVGTFALSNVLQEESGLLEVTLLGIIMANQKYVPVRRISEFKENLQVLLIGCLFIVLSARLELSVLDYFNGPAFLFLALLILLVRPLAVAASSLGTDLNWKEQAFMAWLAPRGIVAAAVASLFAFRLETVFPGEAGAITPLVFLVIVGTVAVYGLTISPVARYLGLAEPDAQGMLIVGAHSWARKVAKAAADLGVRVLMVDSNAKNIEQARRDGLDAETANALSESAVDELNLSGVGRLLALTPNDEVNSLAALNFAEVFESNEVYQLASRPDVRRESEGELPQHLRGRPLFGEDTNHVTFTDLFNAGGEVKTFELSAGFTYETLQERYDDEAIPLFLRRGDELIVFSERGA